MNALSSVTYLNNNQNLDSNSSIHSDNIEQILRGASILSGGGGGSYREAYEDYREISPSQVEVRDLSEFNQDANIATIFGLGPVNHSETTSLAIAQESVSMYEQEYGGVDGVILGELGPDLIIEAISVANRLDIPIANADVAGMRTVPSIQNEIIENNYISRTPLVASNGDNHIRIESGIGEEIDREIRNLADEGIYYITGYANTATDYVDSQAPTGWMEECLQIGEENFRSSLEGDIRNIGSGILESVNSEEINGHTVGRMTVEGEETLEVFFQNENLLAYRDGEQVSQAPNTISVIDDDGVGISNGHIPEQGEKVEVYEISYDFWQNTECFDLETQEIETNNKTVTFNDTTEFNIQGGQE